MSILRRIWIRIRIEDSSGLNAILLFWSLLWTVLSATDSFATEGGTDDCEANLTCGRETKTVVITEFSRGPKLVESRG
jgi:hypothetical protein